MAFTFPASPATNDTFTVGSRTYTWTGTKWVLSGGVITSSQIEANAITTAKILNSAVTTAKINNNAVTQAKLSADLSAVTVTTAANRDTAVASPFTGQLVFLTDTKKIQVWDGTSWLNITLAPPETPTSLSATALSTTSVSVAFTAGGANGSPITNYKYALSTDSGVTYGSFIALDPIDIASPITISGLSQNTSYYIKLKAVNDMGDSVASAAVTVTTLNTLEIDYLVVAGGGAAGGGGNGVRTGGGGAGGLRSTVTASGGTPGTVESALTLTSGTNYTVTVGAGGAADGSVNGAPAPSKGSNSVFSTITSLGGGGGGKYTVLATVGGSGGGGSGDNVGFGSETAAAGTANQGYAGGAGVTYNGSTSSGGGGGGAGGQGAAANGGAGGNGGIGVAVSITGTSVNYAGGGGGGGSGSGGTNSYGGGAGSSGGTNSGSAGATNKGGGGGGATSAMGQEAVGAAGGSGVVILRYPSGYTITLGAGLTGSTATVGGNKVTTITAGSGNVSWA